MDVIAVHQAAQQAIKRAREGKGPTLIECKCYRLGPHCGVTPDSRPRHEVDKCWERDPLKGFESTLIKRGVLTGEMVFNMDKEIHEEIEEAVKFADESPFPDPREVMEDVYAPATYVNEPDRCKGKTKTYGEAIIEAIMEEMRRDKNIFLMGEEVTTGTFLDLNGLAHEFGKERVRDTPISESGIVGLAVGASLNGMRPIVELMFADYLTIAMDQIVNSAAK
jgi:2-oxoisovalerate dehydrogenase E1 component